jgi:iron complex transport system substrate-binding protein
MRAKNYCVLSLCFAILLSFFSGCAGNASETRSGLGNGWEIQSSMALQYAKNFSVDYYNGGYALLSLSDGSRFLVVPENQAVPDGIDADIVVLKQPIHHIYLVATSAMCLFDALESLGSIRFSGTKADGWYVENARAEMEAGNMLYAGKYSTPDYELIVSEGCGLAIESTMLNHAPEVKEKLEELGVPVLIEQSSFESHPLGRTEWIKLYAVMLGKEALAEKLFDAQAAYMDEVTAQGDTGKTVAFFYINSSGLVVARKSGDYVTKMIELAGGDYVFKNLGDPETATSTVSLEMEQFYATAKDADFIIYNSTIDGEISSLEELIAKSSLLADFKAVRNGDVWCTGQNLFQETTQLGLMISNIHQMLTDASGKLTRLDYIYKLQ